MKAIFLRSACIAAMLVASPALAVAPNANNKSSVDQSGDTQSATVTQTGTNDESIVVQSNARNKATVSQAGIVGGKSTVTQTGTDNQATLLQNDDGSNGNSTPPPINISNITQSGNFNTANVLQTTSTNQVLSSSTIVQSGNGNNAGVNQVDDQQVSTITQVSNNNTATLSQGDAGLAVTDDSWGNTSDIYQGGPSGGNSADITQIGVVGKSYVTQLGNANIAYLYQTGANPGDGNNFSQMFQSGNSNDIEGGQVGYNLSSTVRQGSDFNVATFDQSGHDNLSTIVQDVSINPFVTPANLTYNNAFIQQSGSGQVSHITQLGRDGDARIYQSNVGNLSVVTQEGRRATAVVHQTGANNQSYWDQNFTPTSNAVFLNFPFNYDFGVIQSGDNNISTITQTGIGAAGVYNTYASKLNFGLANNDVYSLQYGNGNNSLINQGGSVNVAVVYTPGSNNKSEIDQIGTQNYAEPDQYSNSNSSLIDQRGSNDLGLLRQYGGSGNKSTILQFGSTNDGETIQSRTGNTADTEQGGNQNEGYTTQSGSFNTSTILQGGNVNQAYVVQSSNSNNSLVSQAGTNGIVSVTQGPSGL